MCLFLGQNLVKLWSTTAGKKFDLADVPPDQAPVFHVSPERVVLGPKEAITATTTGLAAKAGQVSRWRWGVKHFAQYVALSTSPPSDFAP